MAKQLRLPLPGSRYNMLVSHVPFNKTAIDKVIANGTYVTILRHPVATYESIFGFFKFTNYIGIKYNESQDAFEKFLSQANYYLKRLMDPYHKTLLRNRQMFDIGLAIENSDNETYIDSVIQQATKEFDLVMINEYFDESLILLKKLLCWDFKDILYMQQNKRNDHLRFDIDEWKRQRILTINSADNKLYQHFNKTLWRKVQEYGDNFTADLTTFRGMLNKMKAECLDESKFVIDYQDRRNNTFLKKTAPVYCKKMKYEGFELLDAWQKSRPILPAKTSKKLR
uniref:Galactosylceramide sulfotransferase-like n=1 Tax=Saccoglossus kowalevskii TaxID=10224 RepID=A0ABM0MYR3_SACKO|nr:PREDICTED: galactosylceramide sulfotransferase-like [Saccoglossus kowalevskii]